MKCQNDSNTEETASNSTVSLLTIITNEYTILGLVCEYFKNL